MIVASLGGLALGFAAVVALFPDAHQGIEISQIEYGKLWPFVMQKVAFAVRMPVPSFSPREERIMQ